MARKIISTSPSSLEDLQQRADLWLEEESTRCRALALERELLVSSTVEGIVGRSPALLDLLTKVRRVAPHCTTALGDRRNRDR
ncbi:MAG: hypothetical protein WDO18_06395 [Acidobacteriota bacterium]